MAIPTVFLSNGTNSPFPLPFFGIHLTSEAVSNEDAYADRPIGQLGLLASFKITYARVRHSSVESRVPGGDEEAQSVTGEQQDTVDEGPFLRFDPIIISVVVSVIQDRVESCAKNQSHRLMIIVANKSS